MLGRFVSFTPFFVLSIIFIYGNFFNDIEFYKGFRLTESLLIPGILGDLLSSISVFGFFVSPALFLIYFRYIVGIANPYLTSIQSHVLFLLLVVSYPFFVFFNNILPQGLATLLIAHAILLHRENKKVSFLLFMISFFTHPVSIAFSAIFYFFHVNVYLRFFLSISAPIVFLSALPIALDFIPPASKNFGTIDLSYFVLMSSILMTAFYYHLAFHVRGFFIGLAVLQALLVLFDMSTVLIERFFYSHLFLLFLLLSYIKPFGRRFSFNVLVFFTLPFIVLSAYVIEFHNN